MDGDVLMYCDTPPLVHEHFENLAKRARINVTKDDANIGIEMTIGDLSTYQNSFEPPTSTFEYELMFDFVSALVSEDDAKVSDVATKIFDYELDVKWADKVRSPLAKSESNCEHCLFTELDFGRVMSQCDSDGLVLLNPSKGTLSRFNTHYEAMSPQVVVLPDLEPEQKKAIEGLCLDMGYEYSEIPRDMLDRDKFYYVSFNGSIGERLGLKYIGWEPNPINLGTRNIATDVTVHGDRVIMVYHRYKVERKLEYWLVPKKGLNIYPVDYLHEIWIEKSQLRREDPFLHDLWASFLCYTRVLKPVARTVYPVGTKYLVGKYQRRGTQILGDDGKIVFQGGTTALAQKGVSREWVSDPGNGSVMQQASYMISIFGSCAYFLGEKYPVRRVPSHQWSKQSCGQHFVKDFCCYEECPYDVSTEVLRKGVVGQFTRSGHHYVEVDKIPTMTDLLVLGEDHQFSNSTYQMLGGHGMLYDPSVLADSVGV